MRSNRTRLFQLVLWTIFFNGLIASLISLQSIVASGLPESSLARSYLLLQQLGHFQFLALVTGLPLLLLSLLLPLPRLITPLLMLLFSAFSLLIFIDYSVFTLYRFHLNGMVWNMLTGGAIEEIFVFDAANIASAALFIAIIFLVQAGIQYFIHTRQNRTRWISGGWVATIVILIQLSGQSLYAWSDAWYKTDVLTQVRFIPLPQVITIKRFLADRGWLPDIAEDQKLSLSSNGQFNYPLQPLQCDTPARKPNILFIISDGLRFDMLNPEVMPVWSDLAQQSQVFEHHLSTGNATRFGVYGLFTGLFSHYWFDSLNTQTSSVFIDQLKQQDYQFGFFTNARLTSPEFDKAVFSSVSEHIPLKTAGRDVIEREYEITRQSKAFIQQNKDKPFFGLVFFDAPHAYVYPAQDEKFTPALKSINYLSINNDTDPLPFLNRYKNSVYFTDRLSGEIIQQLKQQAILDNTIIIMTGDHGQEANETGTNSWGHNSNFSRYQTQVPMVIYWPGKQAARYSHLTSHVDIVPTLMQEVFSCNNKVADYSNGRSLFDQQERDFVLVKNWNNQAVVSKQSIRVFPKIGPTETLDYASYQKIESDTVPNTTMADVIEQISRFYKN